MGIYRSKPKIVEAVQWTGNNGPEVRDFMGLEADDDWPRVRKIALMTIHGEIANALPGDWIVKEPKPGRFYPVKPDIFHANYEPAGDVAI